MAETQTQSPIEEQLRALVRLQTIDSRITQLAKMRGDLPEEIADLEDEKAGLETRLAQMDSDRKEGEVQRKKLKLDVAESEGLIRKYEEQQLNVRNNREYDALTKEIEAHRQRISNAEGEDEAIAARDEGHDDAVAELQGRLGELDTALAEKQEELERVVTETEAEEKGYQAQRDAAAEAIDERYRRAYERLRAKMRDGRAVVAIERGAAAGYAVPPQRQVEVRQRDRIIPCEHTGRIIVDADLYREIAEEMDEAAEA